MKISAITNVLSALAPAAFQESYDNTGLLVGNPEHECTGVLCTLDATEAVVLEAVQRNCNLVIAHHPIIFSGLKRLNGSNYIERSVITAIKNDVAIFAIHTNLDNILTGVNSKIADRLGLVDRSTLVQKSGTLMKLVTFVPQQQAAGVRSALFSAGAGKIGQYAECSFNVSGTGTYKPGEGSNPFVGSIGHLHEENEVRIEVVFPAHLQGAVVKSLLNVHPYEEVAYDVIPLSNGFSEIGSGLIGKLPDPMAEQPFLEMLKREFSLKVIRHTPLLNKPVQQVAVCGGSGTFLTRNAIQAGADVFVTADVKYHEFFDADSKLVIADIGHYESEQYTTELLYDVLQAKFPTFAILKSGVITNPVNYF
ncbi:Nif3-like dinuclear metal center hexameric protein [Segetibacter sp. 3557_3]|uniref:Nif3-like dinuclear metal center hexameric protein n=1 Tax=Segetibacter sp. 3557_3 TaxID=2547429 RepID=UPI001058EE4C|nr:Nif3-like dinuclear metal center hexameric protein [Segetibacter sp. 3557_3]TDH27889.1 Nif3-like dinuclear metal center hexameric protein [Segetibacter sp. 3557_3]